MNLIVLFDLSLLIALASRIHFLFCHNSRTHIYVYCRATGNNL